MAAPRDDPPPVDPAVVARARRGDAAAFEALVRAYERRVWALAWRLTLDAELARDVAQEAFLRLYEQFGRYDPARPFEPWFLTLVSNLALNAKARARVRRAASLDAPDPASGEARQDPPDPGAPAPAQGAAEDEARAAIRAAVAALPPMYSGVVALHYLEGLGVKEIGARLGLPVGTVKIRLHRARSALRAKLERFGGRAG